MTITDLPRRDLHNGLVHFEMQLSEPFEYTSCGRTCHTIHNVSLDVMCQTASRAIELALTAHPRGTIHVVQRRGVSNLLGSPDIVKERLEET